MLARACFEINTGYLEMSKRQSRISEELTDGKKKSKSYMKGKDGLDLTHVFQIY